MIQLPMFANVFRKGMLAPLAALAAVMLIAVPAVSFAMSGEEERETSFTMGEVAEVIGADALHQRGVSGDGVTVAVIDSGVEPVKGLHMKNKLVVGPDFSFEAGLEEFHGRDTYGHGTVMASIIAGGDSVRGPRDDFRGIAPGAQILSVKVADNTGAVDVSQVIAAIDWVIANRYADGMDVRVINLSYRTNSAQNYRIDPLAAAVERAWHAGIVVVAAAGNDGEEFGRLGNPAMDPYVIAVAASEEAFLGDQAAFSSEGDNARTPDLTAPGERILGLGAPESRLVQENPTAFIKGRFLRGSGTSQAAAITSGAVALLLEQRPELSPDQVKALLMLSADHVDDETGAVEPVAGGTVIERLLDPSLDFVAPATTTTSPTQGDKVDDSTGGSSRGNGGGKAKGRDKASRTTTAEATSASTTTTENPETGNSNRENSAARREITRSTEPADVIERYSASWQGDWIGELRLNRGVGTGLLNVSRAASYDALDFEQRHARSDGSGTLEAARGTDHVTLPDGSLLAGEVTFTGSSWSGSSWSGSSWSGSSWSGSSWSGSSWSGSSWSGSSWSGSSWSGSSWSGSSWSGSSWSGSSWSGSSWSGSSWS